MSDDIAAIRARWAAVPAPPWEAWHFLVRRVLDERDEDGVPFHDVLATAVNDGIATALAHAPADIRALLAEIDTVRAALAAQSQTNAELLRRLARERELVGELTRESQRLQRERDEFYAAMERAQTAQQAWTEIGARAEQRLVAIVAAAGAVIDRWADDEEPHPFDREMSDLAFLVNGDEAGIAADTPLLAAAQRLVKAWDRLSACVEEFEEFELEAMACGELKQELDDAIVALKALIEDGRTENAPEMSPPCLDSADGVGDDQQ